MTLAMFGGEPVRSAEFTAWPVFSSEEESALIDVVRSGKWGGYGVEIQEFEESFRKMHEVKHAVTCSNGTVALEVALRAIGIKCGDEVIVTPFTFIASASAILLCEGVPVFADIDPETLNLTPATIEAVITPRTKAVVVVHFGGHPAEMDAIMAVASKHGLLVVEDCSHALGARWKGTPVGNFGAVGTFSFQSFKLATSGEGGAVATNDAAIADAAWSYCNQGRRRGAAWYEHYTLGTNYRLTAFQGAVLGVQLKRVREQTAIRTRNAEYLRSQLDGFSGITTGKTSEFAQDHPQYLMTLRYDPSAFAGIPRDLFLAAVEAEGIPLRAAYPHPLYRNPLFGKETLARHGGHGWKSIPDYSGLHLEECERVCLDGLWVEHQLFLGAQRDMDDILAAFHKVQENRSVLEKHHHELAAGLTRR
ncbi:MAG: DegT/DnrJ/EryC1/StrS family aminotransferase [Edaphobacter sp.]